MCSIWDSCTDVDYSKLPNESLDAVCHTWDIALSSKSQNVRFCCFQMRYLLAVIIAHDAAIGANTTDVYKLHEFTSLSELH